MKKRSVVVLSVVALAVVTLGSAWVATDTRPSNNAVVVIQCDMPSTRWVVTSASSSVGAPVLDVLQTPPLDCAQAVANLLNGGYTIEHVSDYQVYTLIKR